MTVLPFVYATVSLCGMCSVSEDDFVSSFAHVEQVIQDYVKM